MGSLLLQLKLPYGDTYRAYLGAWAGRPATRPAVAVGGKTLYASWNGRTGIARWQFLTGADAAHLEAGREQRVDRARDRDRPRRGREGGGGPRARCERPRSRHLERPVPTGKR